MSSKTGVLHISNETIIQLQALSLPGESLDSVIQRAVLALQTLEGTSRQEAMVQRMNELESRIQQLEHRYETCQETE
ncbi:hypothetical protein ThidrDRAFT_3042 [Thiorhodococcus drewsii AZ1]|uniref:Uncharacterized protein n=1 Tax=Thiorhodococcus drewsii AZ1 TaxID=765913 RepID=G2E429_9GAMM|nr:hypothetical protein [Thiorhodococcus drewsii]EGV29922.1 hypothetical protein ThidrDRAFT_3042 [Thiorhodococcus drewsii AZ1]